MRLRRENPASVLGRLSLVKHLKWYLNDILALCLEMSRNVRKVRYVKSDNAPQGWLTGHRIQIRLYPGTTSDHLNPIDLGVSIGMPSKWATEPWRKHRLATETSSFLTLEYFKSTFSVWKCDRLVQSPTNARTEPMEGKYQRTWYQPKQALEFFFLLILPTVWYVMAAFNPKWSKRRYRTYVHVPSSHQLLKNITMMPLTFEGFCQSSDGILSQ